MKYFIIMLTLLASLSASAFEKEDFYNKMYCDAMGGTFQSYYPAPITGATGASLDCETDDVAWEGEWSYKSYEAIGQSLWYASITDKMPGILFYVKSENQQKYIDRAILTLDSLNIDYQIVVINLIEEKKHERTYIHSN